MIYWVNSGKLEKVKDSHLIVKDTEGYICIFTKEEMEDNYYNLKIDEKIAKGCIEENNFRFESHLGYEFMAFSIPQLIESEISMINISIYFRKNLLVFASDDLNELKVIDKIRLEAEEEKGEKAVFSLERMLQLFFDQLIILDSGKLDLMEVEISNMEEIIMTSNNKDYTHEIIAFRKKLMIYKRYYDRLISILEAMEENTNGLFSKNEVRYFRILIDRTRHLLEGVRFLQEYLSQIREAYQAQIDINLNSIMKLSTVITTIFLPLTLIVGWYGMNFNIPEYQFIFGYPLVITVSAVISILIIVYFKKNKWF